MGRINIEKIAKSLGAGPRGKVSSSGGYFGALQLVEEVRARFQVPSRGGRATDPSWTKRRLVPLAEGTLERLEHIAQTIEARRNIRIEPMQVAAILLENITHKIADEDAVELLQR